MDSDWEEPGERSWDTMRALDYLLSWADVDPGRIILSGLSLSGEVTADTAGLDPRLFMSIPAGYSPDQSVMLYNGSHPCWQWQHADIREYVDISDYFALNVPRPLLIETGKQDYTFSWRNPPFSSDKQVARRNLASYSAEATQFNLYLHYDQHHYHVGDINPTSATEQGVSVPDELEPLQPWDQTWQVSGSTHRIQPTLFAAIASAAMIPPPDFSLAVSPAAPTVTAAQSTSFLLTVTPAGGFNDSLSLSCTNLPPQAACVAVPANLQPDGVNPTTAQITISTTAPALSFFDPERPPTLIIPLFPNAQPILSILLAGLWLAAGAGFCRRRYVRVRPGLMLVGVCLLGMLWASCGGGGTTGKGSGKPGTPPGTYQVGVDVSSGTLHHDISVTLTVN